MQWNEELLGSLYSFSFIPETFLSSLNKQVEFLWKKKNYKYFIYDFIFIILALYQSAFSDSSI